MVHLQGWVERDEEFNTQFYQLLAEVATSSTDATRSQHFERAKLRTWIVTHLTVDGYSYSNPSWVKARVQLGRLTPSVLPTVTESPRGSTQIFGAVRIHLTSQDQEMPLRRRHSAQRRTDTTDAARQFLSQRLRPEA